jgi:hypothetical protein
MAENLFQDARRAGECRIVDAGRTRAQSMLEASASIAGGDPAPREGALQPAGSLKAVLNRRSIRATGG